MNTATDTEKIHALEDYLKSRVIGQDEAIERISGALENTLMGMSDPCRPLVSMLLLGTTGVVKTKTTADFSNFIFGPEKFFKFDMSEFQHHDHVKALIGEPGGYPGRLSDVLDHHDSGVLLFDEMEKAHTLVLDLFLQMLNDATITNAHGKKYNVSKFCVIMTSNIGGHEIMDAPDYVKLDALERSVMDCLYDELRPEFIGRFDENIIFRKLSNQAQKLIVTAEFDLLATRLKTLGHEISLNQQALYWLARKAITPDKGARNVRREVERNVMKAVRTAFKAGGSTSGILKPSIDNLTLEIAVPVTV